MNLLFQKLYIKLAEIAFHSFQICSFTYRTLLWWVVSNFVWKFQHLGNLKIGIQWWHYPLRINHIFLILCMSCDFWIVSLTFWILSCIEPVYYCNHLIKLIFFQWAIRVVKSKSKFCLAISGQWFKSQFSFQILLSNISVSLMCCLRVRLRLV